MESKVKIGKHKGKSFINVPKEYAEWQRMNGNNKFYYEWLENSRFNKHTHFVSHTSPDGRWFERKLQDGTCVFFINNMGSGLCKFGRIYYLVDSDGNYVRDLKSFGSVEAKQGAIDTTCVDWITLTPNGNKLNGKMIVSPYYEHFPYETYQAKITLA